jgi:hypothetical protein
MSVLGACWNEAEVERRMILGKIVCINGSNNWKVTQHVRMQESVQRKTTSRGGTPHVHGRKT